MRVRTTGRTWEPAMVIDNPAPRSYVVHLRPCDHGQSLKPAKQWVRDERVLDGECGESYDNEGEHKEVTPEKSESTECQNPEGVVQGDAVEPRPPETLYQLYLEF